MWLFKQKMTCDWSNKKFVAAVAAGEFCTGTDTTTCIHEQCSGGQVPTCDTNICTCADKPTGSIRGIYDNDNVLLETVQCGQMLKYITLRPKFHYSLEYLIFKTRCIYWCVFEYVCNGLAVLNAFSGNVKPQILKLCLLFYSSYNITSNTI